MPNFCAVTISSGSDYVSMNRQRAFLNEEETDYIYKSTEEMLKKDNLRIVFVQNTEDTDIKKLGISRADTREEYMNWQTNAAGETIGFEVISQPADAKLGQKVNGGGSLLTAYTDLLSTLNINL